jgi:hypothetical protein
LVQAAETGNIASVEALLTGGADVNARTETGTTALMRAASFGQVELVHVLLNKGAEINQERNDGFTALSLAVFFGQIDVLKLLLQRGADPTIKSRFETSPEMWANARGFQHIARLLRGVPSEKRREASEAASTEDSVVSPTSSAAAEKVDTQIERPRASGNRPECEGELREPCEQTLEMSPISVWRANNYRAEMASPMPETTVTISNWRRVTVATLAVMLVCGVGTILLLEISNMRAKSQTTSLPKSDPERAATQMKDPSKPLAVPVPLNEIEVFAPPASEKRGANESFAETGKAATSKLEAAARKGPASEIKVWPDSHSEKTVRTNLKQTPASKKDVQASSANTTMSSPSRAQVTAKTLASQSTAASSKAEPNVKSETKTRPAPLSIEPQRPRRVEQRTVSQPTTSETNSPIVSRARSAKTKVIQWPSLLSQR